MSANDFDDETAFGFAFSILNKDITFFDCRVSLRIASTAFEY
jgi:hypothetical protein